MDIVSRIMLTRRRILSFTVPSPPPFTPKVVADGLGNVVCFDHGGREVWEQRVGGLSVHAPTIGDVDGDGHLGECVLEGA